MKLKTALLAAACAALLTLPAQAILSITNWAITTDSLSFDITGDAASVATPSNNPDTLYVGPISNDTWINSSGGATSFSGTADEVAIAGANAIDVGGFADYISFSTGGIPMDFTNGGTISISVNFSGVSGQFTPANIDVNDVIISWGFNTTSQFPDPSTQLNTVPEPATYAALAGLGVMALAGLRRKTKV